MTNKDDAHKLDEAIDHLTKSLDPSLRSGGVPDSKHGEKVFSEEKDAVNKLVELIKDKKSNIPDATLLGFINRLVAADHALAKAAINQATSTPGAKPEQLKDASKEFDKAYQLFLDGKYVDAIEHYKNAWQHAQEAVK